MAPTVDELFRYVQERCLWQFFSREWDRAENIQGLLGTAAGLLAGASPPLATPMDRLFYADAKPLVAALRQKFPDLPSLPPAELDALFAALKERVTEVAVTKSQNKELTQHLY
jgi:vanadium nitrogenase delta subunit